MLRKALLVLALGLLGAGLIAFFVGAPSWMPLSFWGAVLGAAVIFERWRYATSHNGSPGSWQATGERFIDPESGRAMQVYYNPATGERRYEPAGTDRPSS